MQFLKDHNPIVNSFIFLPPKPAYYDKTSFPEVLSFIHPSPDRSGKIVEEGEINCSSFIPSPKCCLEFFKSEDLPWILFFHGNASDLGLEHEFLYGLFNKLNVNVFCPEYFGYGPYAEDKKPNESNCYETSLVALDYLQKKRNASISSIIIVGQSLGSGVACFLASKHQGWKGLVLISPFQSIKDMCPKGLAPFIGQRFPNLERIKHIQCKLLIIHGLQDQVVPFEHSLKLIRASGSKEKKLFEIDADHNTIQPSDIEERLQTFFRL